MTAAVVDDGTPNHVPAPAAKAADEQLVWWNQANSSGGAPRLAGLTVELDAGTVPGESQVRDKRAPSQ
jgi:hypothetical protein